ncbi:myosin light chain kinase 3-like [Protopterus annectens]|uniref:myosin light chain kinase 3-like n=1 Tax=Protopterus annectens TaxID=7888 RepID=UPI001CFB41C6|nr:myosin light chain kinase 3-like [Protopterus annectens]
MALRMNYATRGKLLKLNHENILQIRRIVYDFLTTRLTSEFLANYTSTVLAEAKQAGKLELISYFEQTADALQYLHKSSIIHCDMKCQYIFVNHTTKKVKLAHFGRSVYLEESQADSGQNPHVVKQMAKESYKCFPDPEFFGAVAPQVIIPEKSLLAGSEDDNNPAYVLCQVISGIRPPHEMNPHRVPSPSP